MIPLAILKRKPVARAIYINRNGQEPASRDHQHLRYGMRGAAWCNGEEVFFRPEGDRWINHRVSHTDLYKEGLSEPA